QEFWGGMRVRMRQTGGDPVTSLTGIILSKRRKYGGYIIHAGIAVMFLGFGGRAFETEQHFTLRPGETYQVRDYTLTFEELIVDDTDSEHVIKVMTRVPLERDG